jgi:hypothetical protein
MSTDVMHTLTPAAPQLLMCEAQDSQLARWAHGPAGYRNGLEVGPCLLHVCSLSLQFVAVFFSFLNRISKHGANALFSRRR